MASPKAVFFLVALCFASLVLGQTDISRPDKRVAPKPGVALKPADNNVASAQTCTDCVVGSLTVLPLDLVKSGN